MTSMGILGYSDRLSVRAGETIRFMVSCDTPQRFRADLVRIRCGDLNPAGPGYKEVEIANPVNGEYAGRHQPIHAGSYVRVPPSRQLDGLAAFTVSAMLWPTTPGGREQAILSCWDAAAGAGFEVLLDAGGALALRVGDGRGGIATASTGVKLLAADWCLLVATYDPATGMARLHQRPRTEYAGQPASVTVERRLSIAPSGSGAPLLIAARVGADGAPATAHYNGKIDAPRLARAALPLADAMLLQQAPTPRNLQRDLVAAWDFSRTSPERASPTSRATACTAVRSTCPRAA